MNHDQVKVIVIAKQVGLPIQAKINQIIEASKDFPGGNFFVPVWINEAVLPPFPQNYLPSEEVEYSMVAIPTELYQDEEGNKLLLGYDETYSILVYKWRKAG